MANINSNNFFANLQSQRTNNNIPTGNDHPFNANSGSGANPDPTERFFQGYVPGASARPRGVPTNAPRQHSINQAYGIMSSVIDNTKSSYSYLVTVAQAFLPKECYVSSDMISDIFAGKVKVIYQNELKNAHLNHVPNLTSRQDLLDRCLRHPIARLYVHWYWKRTDNRKVWSAKLVNREFFIGLLLTFDNTFQATYHEMYNNHLKRKRYGIIDEVEVNVNPDLTTPDMLNVQSMRNTQGASTTIVSRMTRRYMLDNDELYRKLYEMNVRINAREWTRIRHNPSQLQTYTLMVTNLNRSNLENIGGTQRQGNGAQYVLPTEFAVDSHHLIPNDNRSRMLITLNNILSKIKVNVTAIDYSNFPLNQLEDLLTFTRESLDTISLRVTHPVLVEYSYAYLAKLLGNILIVNNQG